MHIPLKFPLSCKHINLNPFQKENIYEFHPDILFYLYFILYITWVSWFSVASWLDTSITGVVSCVCRTLSWCTEGHHIPSVWTASRGQSRWKERANKRQGLPLFWSVDNTCVSEDRFSGYWTPLRAGVGPMFLFNIFHFIWHDCEDFTAGRSHKAPLALQVNGWLPRISQSLSHPASGICI